MTPNKKKGFECYVDASHAGDWKQQSASDDPSTARSRTGYIITIASSTTEAEYIALSTPTREILPMLTMAKEASKRRMVTKINTPLIHCKLFKDNQGDIELANVPKMHPRTRHLNIKYRFFRRYVQQGILQVLHISGADQAADIFTKNLS